MVHPVLSGGYVLDGGALCMELMTPQVCHALELIKLAGSLGLGARDITGLRRFEAHDTRESLLFEPQVRYVFGAYDTTCPCFFEDHDVAGLLLFWSSRHPPSFGFGASDNWNP
jgi:hypothetical protein